MWPGWLGQLMVVFFIRKLSQSLDRFIKHLTMRL